MTVVMPTMMIRRRYYFEGCEGVPASRRQDTSEPRSRPRSKEKSEFHICQELRLLYNLVKLRCYVRHQQASAAVW